MKRAFPPVFQGSITALPTPFRGGSIDFSALLRLIELQVEGGTDGLVVGGTTGEAAALTTEERAVLFAYVVGAARGRVPVVAGVGSSDTRVACRLARTAQAVGCDGLLATTPAYSRPSQEGLRRHLAAIAEATRLPVALYNIPTRTGIDLLPRTAAELATRYANIVAIKEASDTLERIHELLTHENLAVLCGDDTRIADCMQMGAAGVVSVVSNLVPGTVARLVHAFDDGQAAAEAPALVETLGPLTTALSVESNPAPLKAALEILGFCEGELRLPLVPVSPANAEVVRGALGAAGLLAD